MRSRIIARKLTGTGAGELLGDLRFMSPGVTLGLPCIDHRADLYSLGALT
jgi:hypothetical protein